MKKTLLLAAFALAGTFAFAQKPSAGSRTAEVNLNFQTGTAAINYNAPELRFRYFLADNAAVRVRLGMGSTTTTTSHFNAAQDKSGDITNKTGLGIYLAPGYEMHFEGTSKLSPYAGAQLMLNIGGAASTEVKNAAVPSPAAGGANFVDGASYSSTAGSTFGFGLGLICGADYYIADNIFVGGEFGLGLFNMTSVGEGTTKVKASATAAEVSGKTAKSSTTSLFGVTSGGVRLGFVF